MEGRVMQLIQSRGGHFLLESGHHGDLWLDLELLCLRPHALQPVIFELARRLSRQGIEAVCGPLVEGAFIGLAVASELDVLFSYSERFARRSDDGMFPAGYRVPVPLRQHLRGKRVAIVNDVINAGSAVKGTFTDLQECGAIVVAIGTLLTLGASARLFASENSLVLEAMATVENRLWESAECPMCAAGTALEDVAGFRASFQE